jgi:hypothetical protein
MWRTGEVRIAAPKRGVQKRKEPKGRRRRPRSAPTIPFAYNYVLIIFHFSKLESLAKALGVQVKDLL